MIARVFMAGGLALGVLSYGFVLLPLDLGIWPQVEPVTIAVHLAAALAAIGLALACWSGNAMAMRALRHPIVLIAAFVAAWSVLMSPFADLPLLSLIGMAQSGEGTLMKADFAVFLAAGLALRSDRRGFDGLAALAVAISWIAAALVLLVPKTRIWGIEDYIAYYAFPVAALVACRVGGTKGALLGIAGALPSLVLSTNNSAITAFIVLAGPVYLIARWRPRSARWIGTGAALAIPIAAIVAVSFVGAHDWIASVRSRELILDVVAMNLRDHPWTLLFGQGWGHTGEVFFDYLSSTRATLYDESWDVVFRDHFHSLNYAVEALTSAGLPAAIASIALFAAIAIYAPGRRAALAAAFVAGHGMLASLWFELPMTVPVVALAIGALVSPMRPRAPSRSAPLLAGVVAAQIGVAVFLLGWGLSMRGSLAGATACDAWPREDWRADIGLRAAFLDLEKSVLDRVLDGKAIDPQTVARLDSLRCAVDARATATRSGMLASAPVLFRTDVSHFAALAALHPHFAASLPDSSARLRALLSLSPLRTDLAIPYLGELVARADYTGTADFAQWILSHNARDPVGLWFLGLALVESPDPAQQRIGFARLRAGFDAGIERLLPIPPELKARISALSKDSR
jgi:hypothetical protein